VKPVPVPIARLRELIALASSEGVDGIDLIEGGMRIRISRTGDGQLRPSAVPPPPPEQPMAGAPEGDIFAAPMFGILHLTPAPDAPAYVRVGDRISTGQQLCLIEAMKMFNPVVSDRDGRLDAILAVAGSEITSGQPLFRIIGA
jgi:acetyl-CoA carboxylase biotin carboxyl carrier protein